jgi:succinoglycan biosynthesis protein ExoO
MIGAIDVSVIIPAWAAAGTIERAITSALGSMDVHLEVIAVDDASGDNTYDALLRIAATDSRVVIDRLERNSGPSGARNRAIELARGRYVAILDADDIIAPGRLASLIAIADDEQADIVVDNMTEVDEAGRTPPAPFLKSPAFSERREIDLAAWMSFNQPMKPGDCLGYLKPLIRLSKLRESGINYDTSLRNSEDYYLIAHLLAEAARMIYTPEQGYFYTRSVASTSHRLKPEHTAAWLDAERRFRERYAGKVTADVEAALVSRERNLRYVNQFVSAVDAMKDHRLVEVAGLLISDVRASVYTLTTLAKIAAAKALNRKFV